ncbi:LLM class flavin-dependent oxidoreductase [Streptomyces sp. NPDC059153]|uniref:LLM class flavin-dependent oxidoreductase n=1 Tax=Streptomyces sp. NPDC059153 TaxID=3346743 RepID=UPI00367D83EB
MELGDERGPVGVRSGGLEFRLTADQAEATSRVEFGPPVTSNSCRNPDLPTDMACTTDHISEGRLILGIGSGWYERDYLEYGYEFGTAGSRLDALGEALPRIRRRREQLDPRPTRKIPLLIGGNGVRKTLRFTAEHADIWHGFGQPAEIAERHQVLDDRCVRIGRDPGEIECSARVFRQGPDEVGPGLLDVGTRLFQLVSPGPVFDIAPVLDRLAFRDDMNRSGAPDHRMSQAGLQ